MKKLRFGVIGTGSVVREIYRHLYFASRYSGLIDVVAACDVRPESLDWFCEEYRIPVERRFTDYRRLLDGVELDAVAVNTPDSFHRAPVCAALEAGVDVVVPKPTAASVVDAHAMIETARRHGRYLGVDFHKRSDPVVIEAAARHRSGRYGTLQVGVFSMLDKLMVADPNHEPRFFASSDFAERNSPVSFLTSHMADTFIAITGLYPVSVQAVGYRQKLRSLSPIASQGYDLVDTTMVCENGATVHMTSGWILPNTANCITVQSGRLLYTDAAVDLWKEWYGYHEIAPDGINDRNVLFLNFAPDGKVGGFGITNPGTIIERVVAHRSGEPVAEAALSPVASGLLTTLVCECAHESLAAGGESADGVVSGSVVDARAHLERRLGRDVAASYYDKPT